MMDGWIRGWTERLKNKKRDGNGFVLKGGRFDSPKSGMRERDIKSQ